MTEVQAILTTGSSLGVIYISGWLYNRWTNNRQSGHDSGVSAERQENIEKRLDELPCRDSKYMVEWGMVRQGMEDMQLSQTRLEDKVEKRLTSVEKQMRELYTAIRLRAKIETNASDAV